MLAPPPIHISPLYNPNNFPAGGGTSDYIHTTNGIGVNTTLINPRFSGSISGITKETVGLGNVDNTSDKDKPISDATRDALLLKAPINNPAFTGTVTGVSKGMVGLGNVDNTSDAAKPVSSATQTALNLKANSLNAAFDGFTTFRNLGPSVPAVSPVAFGAISTNYQSGHADVDFWNTWGRNPDATAAFRFYNLDAAGVPSLLLNMLRNGNTTFLGSITSAGATFTALLTATGGISLPAGQTLTIVGNISANSTVVTPIALSRIAALTSDCQTQINNLQTQINALPAPGSLLASNNTWSGTNSFGNTIFFKEQILSTWFKTVNTQFQPSTTLGLDNSTENMLWQLVRSPALQILFGAGVGTLKYEFTSSAANFYSALNAAAGITCTNLTVSGTATGISKAMVGLGNVDNTSDTAKPVSSATQTALNLKANTANPNLTGYTYFNNVGSTTFTGFGTGYFGAITANLTGGNAEMDFVNTGFLYTNPTAYSFIWYLATSATTRTALASIRNNGNFNIIGNFSAVAAAFTGALSGTTATFSDLLTGTTATFSGAVSSAGAAFTSAITGTSAVFSGLITVGATVGNQILIGISSGQVMISTPNLFATFISAQNIVANSVYWNEYIGANDGIQIYARDPTGPYTRIRFQGDKCIIGSDGGITSSGPLTVSAITAPSTGLYINGTIIPSRIKLSYGRVQFAATTPYVFTWNDLPMLIIGDLETNFRRYIQLPAPIAGTEGSYVDIYIYGGSLNIQITGGIPFRYSGSMLTEFVFATTNSLYRRFCVIPTPNDSSVPRMWCCMQDS